MLNAGPLPIDNTSDFVLNDSVSLAVDRILSEKDSNQALILSNYVFTIQEPRIWEAFLRNDILNAILKSSQLKSIVDTILLQLGKTHEKSQIHELSSVLETLHQKPLLVWSLHESLSSEDRLHFILKLAKFGLIDVAAQWIIQEDDDFFVQNLFINIFNMPQPKLWHAFLQNEVFKVTLINKSIQWILKLLKLKLSSDIVEDRAGWEKVLVLIAQNSNWCRVLSYSFFIEFAMVSVCLRDYITSTASFCTHLEPFHIAKLATLFPDNEDKLILTLLSALKNGNDEDKQIWAILSFKRLLIISETVQVKINTNPDYHFILLVLKEEFKIDRLFALEVLKNPNLVETWMGQNKLIAYKHKLFTTKDYKLLSKYYKHIDLKVSETYESFCTEELKEHNPCQSISQDLTFEYEDVFKQFIETDYIDDELMAPMKNLLISQPKPEKKSDSQDFMEFFEREAKSVLERIESSFFPRNK